MKTPNRVKLVSTLLVAAIAIFANPSCDDQSSGLSNVDAGADSDTDSDSDTDTDVDGDTSADTGLDAGEVDSGVSTDTDDPALQGDECETMAGYTVPVTGICKLLTDDCVGGFASTIPASFGMTQNCALGLDCCIGIDQCSVIHEKISLWQPGRFADCTKAEDCHSERSAPVGCPPETPICCVPYHSES